MQNYWEGLVQREGCGESIVTNEDGHEDGAEMGKNVDF